MAAALLLKIKQRGFKGSLMSHTKWFFLLGCCRLIALAIIFATRASSHATLGCKTSSSGVIFPSGVLSF
uniref:Uncharacterized protein LOC8287159 n=1 Tax=Rhizophora mucronata TaxID=61149 RepID=A0A2P2JHL3_RHIMU